MLRSGYFYAPKARQKAGVNMSKAKTIFYQSDTEGLDEIAEALLNGETVTAISSNIEDKTDFWSIDNVPYRNRVCRVDLSKALLDSGNAKTQDEWAEYSRQAQQSNGFYVGDFPLYYALFSQLHSLREDPSMRNTVEEARKFISKQMFEKWLVTLTRLQYKKSGEDTIVHGYGTPDPYEIQGEIVENDGLITDADTKAQSMLELLTGESDVAKVNEVYKWMTEKETYLLRVNSKRDIERVAGFIAYSGRVYLFCDGDPGGSGASLGVKIYDPQGRA
ncbi:hypothetical protein HY500_01825 [Candidatus Woesearchaeota archaeon]|nr:hypothetical protein [Candidatus Woesearchaeota archaeon]